MDLLPFILGMYFSIPFIAGFASFIQEDSFGEFLGRAGFMFLFDTAVLAIILLVKYF